VIKRGPSPASLRGATKRSLMVTKRLPSPKTMADHC
jgi:hypothetical protein